MTTLSIIGPKKLSKQQREEVRKKLWEEVETAVERGYDTFQIRAVGDTDKIFCQIINELAQKYPEKNLSIYMILVCATIPSGYKVHGWHNTSAGQSLNRRGSAFARDRIYAAKANSLFVVQFDQSLSKRDTYIMDTAKLFGHDIKLLNLSSDIS